MLFFAPVSSHEQCGGEYFDPLPPARVKEVSVTADHEQAAAGCRRQQELVVVRVNTDRGLLGEGLDELALTNKQTNDRFRVHARIPSLQSMEYGLVLREDAGREQEGKFPVPPQTQ